MVHWKLKYFLMKRQWYRKSKNFMCDDINWKKFPVDDSVSTVGNVPCTMDSSLRNVCTRVYYYLECIGSIIYIWKITESLYLRFYEWQ